MGTGVQHVELANCFPGSSSYQTASYVIKKINCVNKLVFGRYSSPPASD